MVELTIQQSLSEALAVPLPVLPSLPSNTIVTGTGASLVSKTGAEDVTLDPGSVWADDEERRFYTDLLDLRGEVPGSLLKGTASATTDVGEAVRADEAREQEKSVVPPDAE